MPSAHIFRYCGSFGRAVTSRLSAHREELAAEPMHMHTCCFFSGALSLQLSPQWSDSLVNCRPLLGCISDRFESKYGFDIGLPAPPPVNEPVSKEQTLVVVGKGHTGICIDQLQPAPPPPPRPARRLPGVEGGGGAFVILGENPLLSDSDRRGFLLRVERQLRVKF